jgi:hypothetical protein
MAAGKPEPLRARLRVFPEIALGGVLAYGVDDLKEDSVVPDTVLGIPTHPLAVHAPVVFIPLLIVGALLYALVPSLRQRTRWAVVLLALAAPVTAFGAKLSGDAFKARLIKQGRTSAEILNKINAHKALGDATLWVVIALGVVTLVFAFLTPGRRPLQRGASTEGSKLAAGAMALHVVLVVVVIGLAVTSGYYVYRTGDAGAHIVWQGY